MLKVIIFDVDGVLVDSREANIAFYQALLVKAGYPKPSRDEINKWFHLPMRQVLEKLMGSEDQTEISRAFDMGQEPALRDSGLLEFPDQLEEILEKLHAKYTLAIVTSRIKVGMEDIFTAKEIKHFFDVVVTFEDYKNPKPHPEPLQVALRRLNVKANEAIYAGDSKTDVEAATAAGMKCVFLSRENHKDATARIQRLHELLSILEELI